MNYLFLKVCVAFVSSSLNLRESSFKVHRVSLSSVCVKNNTRNIYTYELAQAEINLRQQTQKTMYLNCVCVLSSVSLAVLAWATNGAQHSKNERALVLYCPQIIGFSTKCLSYMKLVVAVCCKLKFVVLQLQCLMFCSLKLIFC